MKRQITFSIIILISLIIHGCTFEKVQPLSPECDVIVPYSAVIKPIINTNCIGCHSAGFASGDFTSYEGLKAKATSGALKNRVVILKDMPQGASMPDSDRNKINCWIEQGALNN